MKKIIIGAAVVIVVCCICAYAGGLGEAVISKFNSENDTIINEYAEVVQNENFERAGLINEALLNNSDVQFDEEESININTELSKYEQLIIAMNATISDPTEFNELLVSYEYLAEVYKLPQGQQDYIADLVIGGCEMNDILGLAYFWVETNDDISIIKSMYDLKGSFEGKSSWYENAYDIVTDAKNGSLTVEEVESYMSKGMTTEDILAADELCRKGVYTINQILDKRCEGYSMAEIANEIENGELISAVMLAEEDFTYVDYNSIENPYAVVDSFEVSLLTGQTQSEVLTAAATGEDIENTLMEKKSDKLSEIRIRLTEEGLLKEYGEDE